MIRKLITISAFLGIAIPSALAGDSAGFTKPALVPTTMIRALSADSAHNDIEAFDPTSRLLSLKNGTTVMINPAGGGQSGVGGLPGSDVDGDGIMVDLDPNAPTDAASGWMGATGLSDWLLKEGSETACNTVPYYEGPWQGTDQTAFRTYKFQQQCLYTGTQVYLGSDGKIYGQRTYTTNWNQDHREFRIRPNWTGDPATYWTTWQQVLDEGRCRCPKSLLYWPGIDKYQDIDNPTNASSYLSYFTSVLFTQAGWNPIDWCVNGVAPDPAYSKFCP